MFLFIREKWLHRQGFLPVPQMVMGKEIVNDIPAYLLNMLQIWLSEQRDGNAYLV